MTLRRRIDHLEVRAAAVDGDRPAYLSFPEGTDLTRLDLPPGVKIYIGVSPDDWDNERGQPENAG